MVTREVVGAHYGLRDWLAQRVTAVIMAVYTIMIVALVAGVPKFDYWYWRGLWSFPAMRYGTILFLLSLYLHAWIGVRNIIMDYVKDTGWRLILYVLTVVALVCYAFWSIQIVWSLNVAAR